MTAWEFLLLVFFGSLICGVEYFLSRRRGFVMGDEGYLWYGALQTAAGRLPVRDFRAYDPGRYWWVAAWLRLPGSGLMKLRMAMMGAKMVAMVCAATILYLAGAGLSVSLGGWALLFLWLRPRHKQVDQAVLMLGLLAAVVYVLYPGWPAAAFLGGVVALAWMVGINHGLYQSVGAVLILLTMAPIQLPVMLAAVVAGLVTLLPLWLTAVRDRGYLSVYWRRKIAPILNRGHANLPVPVPWPWRASAKSWAERLGQFAAGLLFIALPLSLLLIMAMGWLGTGLVSAPQLACALMGLPYLHHAFSRADIGHLAGSIGPLILVSALATPELLAFALLAALLLATAALSGLGGWRYLFALHQPLQAARIDGVTCRVDPTRARLIRAMYRLQKKYGWQGQDVLALPNLVGVYPLLGLDPPVYDCFTVYRGTPALQAELLAALESGGIRAVVVNDQPLDGVEEQRFSRSYPEVWAWITAHGRSLRDADLPARHSVWILETQAVP